MPKQPTNENSTSARIADIAARKAKNASAQAAFRQRRANYITTLEETVTNLESVVLQLQESCREARQKAQHVERDYSRLRMLFHEREKVWRTGWPRKPSQQSDSDDLPPPAPSFSHVNVLNTHTTTYTSPMGYRPVEDPTAETSPYAPSTYAPQTIPFPGGDSDVVEDHSRAQKYTPFFSIQGSREEAWTQAPPHASSSTNDTMGGNADSPTFSTSAPIASSDVPYGHRYAQEEQKVPIPTVDHPYSFSASRSMSPHSSTPAITANVAPGTSSFHFGFPDVAQDRPSTDYRRHDGHSPEMTLHGGTGDISSLASSSSDAVRFRLGNRHDAIVDQASLLPIIPPHETVGPSTGMMDNEDAAGQTLSRLRQRPHSSLSSRSPSPSAAPGMSGTLAVIKAQAFGALRRTRARSKKSTDSSSKVSLEVLESRGIGMGGRSGTKRQRRDLDDDEDDEDECPE